MRKAAMIVHQVRQPQSLPVKVLTQFQPLGPLQPAPDHILARLFLYTREGVFRGCLKKCDVNTQLAWNETSLTTLTDCLNGKRTAIDIRFNPASGAMSLVCEIESGIRVTLFQITLQVLEGEMPLGHMKKVFMGYRQSYGQQESRTKQQREKVGGEVKEMQALAKQIEQQTQTEILHMKKNFVEIVNQCKKKLRRHMKTGICEIVDEEQEQEEETQMRKRTIVRVNREALDRQARSHLNEPMEMDSPPPHEGLQSIFD